MSDMSPDKAEEHSLEMMVKGRDLPWLLSQWAKREPDKIMLVWAPFEGEDEQWSFFEFEAQVRKLAGGLLARGVKQGDRILVHMENCPEFLFAWFACAYIGAVAVTTNSRSVERDLRYFCQHAAVIGAITQSRFAPLIQRAAPDLAFLAVAESDLGEAADIVDNASNCIRFGQLLDAPAFDSLRPADPGLDLSIQFTSGTTSRPKAVVWTHGNVIYAGQQASRNYRLSHADVCHLYLPLFHMYGIAQTFMSALWVGNTVILQPKFSKSNFWRPAMDYKATWSAHIPFALQALRELDVPDHNFRFWSLGVCLPEMGKIYGVKTVGSWGMTETVSNPIMTDLDHDAPPMSIGKPIPGYAVEIRRDDGSLCEAGETGRLFIKGCRGINLFKEYLNDPEATERCFDKNGWLDTGDLVRSDSQGNLYFCDRAKDMIKVGGENVAASEIESVILSRDWVKECAVVAQKHYMLGEVPVAFVIAEGDVPDEPEEDLIQWCRENLPDFKVVRDVYLVKDMPRSVNNKVAKNVLRDKLPIITA